MTIIIIVCYPEMYRKVICSSHYCITIIIIDVKDGYIAHFMVYISNWTSYSILNFIITLIIIIIIGHNRTGSYLKWQYSIGSDTAAEQV